MVSRMWAILTMAFCAALWSAPVALAGPITPPPGPVAGTYKTLTEVEPRIAINATNTPGNADSVFRITQPGSYYLTGNITGVIAKHGIEIDADHVTIDLGGYALLGVAASRNGISTLAGCDNITVRNGVISGWGNNGIDLYADGVVGKNHRVDGITVANCQSFGARLGSTAVVHSSIFESNTGGGLLCQGIATIRDCIARNNGGNGISTGESSTLMNCSSFFNASNGISVGPTSAVTTCVARQNALTGIVVGENSTITNSAARQNSGTGISASNGVSVIGCTATGNQSNGIVVGSGSLVADCAASLNTANGIFLSFDSVARNNVCDSNGAGGGDGAGIYTSSSDNRIEGNNCTDNDRGIHLATSGNLLIGNSCSGNTVNYEIAASNRYGPIINISASGAAAVSGSAAASTLTTTDPHANFAY